jgi:sterol 3beta-glucosyltransferase
VDAPLQEFVAAGTPPVYIGFGSSVGPDPVRLGATVSEALREVGARAVIATGWGGTRGGGRGWRHHGRRAGTAPVAVPTRGHRRPSRRSGDDRPEPLPAKKLTAEKLATAVRAASENPGIQTGASDLSERMGREDGTGQASGQIEAVVSRPIP